MPQDGLYLDFENVPKIAPPTPEILDPAPAWDTGRDLEALARRIKETLRDFRVECMIGDILPGPAVATVEVVPAPGVRIAAIRALAEDLAIALAVPHVRIAPSEGRTCIDIQVLNQSKGALSLRELLDCPLDRADNLAEPIAIPMGRNVRGKTVIEKFSDVGHLLVAGNSSSGRTIFLHALIASLLLNRNHVNVRFLLIDTGGAGFELYHHLPHLLRPPVMEPSEGIETIELIGSEVDLRYRRLAAAGVRNITTFNELASLRADGDEAPSDLMPHLIAIVENFRVYSRLDRERFTGGITKTVAMGRAVGVHLVLSTCEPTTKVVTGVLKATFPVRAVFQVSTRNDSRALLDTEGAEQLFGYGDMLYRSPTSCVPLWLQGFYVSPGEVERICAYFRK